MSDSETLSRIAVEGYEFFYPLVTMDLTRRVATNIGPGVKPGLGPPNAFSHMREFPPGDFREVVRPNFDTLYSPAWLDLTEQPQIVSLTRQVDRYFMLPMLDMWTDVFAVIGTRTTGGDPADYAILPPGWEGDLPEDIARIVAPTPWVWIIGRTQTNGPSDYETVHAIQDGLRITALSDWPASSEVRHEVDPDVDMEKGPKDQVHAMSGAEFFNYASRLFADHPAHVTDQPILARLRRLGIGSGAPFVFDDLEPAQAEAIRQAPKAAWDQMNRAVPTAPRVVNGWGMRRSDIGVYGTNYLYRAVIAMVGLGANLPDDAIYPLILNDSEGNPPVGDNDYLLHFESDQLPPVDAFWSVTMYDEDGFTVPNALDRYALGDRDPLRYGDDGSLDIYVSHNSPGPEREPNWLPAPEGPLGLTMRLYSPRPEVLDGSWNPPPLERINQPSAS